ncbi:MAG: TolB family protein [Bacteroidota bacterium]
MKKELLVAALIFLSISSCKKAENPVSPNWEVSGKIVYSTWGRTYVIDLSLPNPQPRLLVEGGEPRVSPDGKTVVFSMISPQRSFDIYSIGIDGSNMKNLTNRAWIMESWPELSPDGNWIVFTGDTPGYEQLYIMNFYGENIQAITDTSYFAAAGSWSPTGSTIAFSYRLRSNPYVGRLRTISPGGLYMVELDSSAGPFAYPPLWSPDGHWIIYPHMPMPSRPSYHCVINIDTHVYYPLSQDTVVLSLFRWRQDGSILAAGGTRGDTTTIGKGVYRVTIGPNGVTAIQKILGGFQTVSSITQSPDGRYIGIFGSWGQDPGCYFYVYDGAIDSLRKVCQVSPERDFYMEEYYTQWIR